MSCGRQTGDGLNFGKDRGVCRVAGRAFAIGLSDGSRGFPAPSPPPVPSPRARRGCQRKSDLGPKDNPLRNACGYSGWSASVRGGPEKFCFVDYELIVFW